MFPGVVCDSGFRGERGLRHHVGPAEIATEVEPRRHWPSSWAAYQTAVPAKTPDAMRLEMVASPRRGHGFAPWSFLTRPAKGLSKILQKNFAYPLVRWFSLSNTIFRQCRILKHLFKNAVAK